MNQIEAGIDQSAIEIKNEQANTMRIEAAQKTDHGEFRITQVQLHLSAVSLQYMPGFRGWKAPTEN
jgi:hypothetical protein